MKDFYKKIKFTFKITLSKSSFEELFFLCIYILINFYKLFIIYKNK